MPKNNSPQLKFPYELEKLTWNEDHTQNKENIYCYCGKNRKNDDSLIQCQECKQLFHSECVKSLKKPQLIGDTFYIFKCSVCTKGKEQYTRKSISWVNCIQLVVYNILSKKKDKNKNYCRWKEDICTFIDDYWDYFYAGRARSLTWHNTVASVLSTHSSIFQSGFDKFQQPGWWTLKSDSIPNFSNKKENKKKKDVQKEKEIPIKKEQKQKEKTVKKRKHSTITIDDDDDDDFMPETPKQSKIGKNIKSDVITIEDEGEKSDNKEVNVKKEDNETNISPKKDDDDKLKTKKKIKKIKNKK